MASQNSNTGGIWINRTPTCLSLQQLENSCPPVVTRNSLCCTPQPDAAVSDCRGACIAQYTFPAVDIKPHQQQKRVRSFGDLSTLLVPDLDDNSALDMSYSGGGTSSDDGVDMVVPLLDGKTMQRSLARHSLSDGLAVLSTKAAAAGNPAAPLHMGMLDTILRTEWDDRNKQGLFRYNVAACPSVMVPGAYGFVAQLNEGRASKKRPTEFRVDQVAQSFDSTKFNFTKALQKEVLCQFEATLDQFPSYEPLATVRGSPHMIYINVSPIEYGHVLLVPRVLDCCPQVVEPDHMLLALNFVRQVNNPYFRAGFNSLGAYGTINHLHFQAYYLAQPFPIERADTKAVPGLHRPSGRVSISQLSGYPVRGLVFESDGPLAGLAATVGTACRLLTDANVPHNLFIVDRGSRVFLLPNAFAERKAKGLVPPRLLDTQVDPACFELSGHLVLKRGIDFENVSQDTCWELLECASLDEVCFLEAVSVALPHLTQGKTQYNPRSFSGRLSGTFSGCLPDSVNQTTGVINETATSRNSSLTLHPTRRRHYSSALEAPLACTFEHAVPTKGRRATAGDTSLDRRRPSGCFTGRASGTFMRV